MSKPPRIIAFQDDVNYRYAILESDIPVKNVIEHLYQAQNEAEKDGYIGTTSNIPETYLTKHGIKLTPIAPIIIHDISFGKTPAEKKGVYYACCRHCWHYENGVCGKYGGTCDPEDEETDCITGDDIYILRYASESTLYDFILPLQLSINTAVSKETIPWILDVIKENGDEISEDMEVLEQADDYDLENWSLTKTM